MTDKNTWRLTDCYRTVSFSVAGGITTWTRSPPGSWQNAGDIQESQNRRHENRPVGCKRKTITVTHLLFIPLPLSLTFINISPGRLTAISVTPSSHSASDKNNRWPHHKSDVCFVIHINPLSFSVYKCLKNPDLTDNQSNNFALIFIKRWRNITLLENASRAISAKAWRLFAVSRSGCPCCSVQYHWRPDLNRYHPDHHCTKKTFTEMSVNPPEAPASPNAPAACESTRGIS